MKYIIAILLVSFLFIAACSMGDSNLNNDDENIISEDVSDAEIIEELAPGLVDSDETIEIGEMI